MSLLQMSAAGGGMIAAVVLLRALALYRLPKWVFPALWELVLIRLLVPFFLPLFPVFSSPSPQPQAGDVLPGPGYWEAAEGGALPAPASAEALSLDWMQLVWIAGALALGGYYLTVYLQCRRQFRQSLPVENQRALRWMEERPLRPPAALRQSDRISAPLTYGLFRPVILLPKGGGWEEDSVMPCVLAHEWTHIRRRDAWAKLALTAALCVHWFNPLVWLMVGLANRDIELACDQGALGQLGPRSRRAYALALVRMEEARASWNPVSSSFSKNPVEERIVAMMKWNKTSRTAAAAACLIVGSAAVLAAAGPMERQDRALNAKSQIEEQVMLSYADPQDGKTYYSTDGGQTFEALTPEEFEARYPTPEVVWWTYDEYAAWLEQEKIQLQQMIGQKGWTAGRGEFIWDQEMVDETVALYEGILADIGRGALVSKTVDGSEDTMLMMNLEDRFAGAGDQSVSYWEYLPFGLTEGPAGELWYKGEKVRYFEDSVELEPGAISSRCHYFREGGVVSLRTVRQARKNGDGSFDPFGPILRLEKMTAKEAEQRIQETANRLPEATTAETEENDRETQKLLDRYAPFGLTYQNSPYRLDMSWQGKPVHSVYDSEKEVWIANNLYGTDLSSDALDLEAAYENGKLTGLKPIQIQEEASAVSGSQNDGAGEGVPIADLFQKYRKYGLVYKEEPAAGGLERNLYYRGEIVGGFSDISPSGSVFTFGSTREGALKLKTLYSDKGELVGVQPVSE